jgi:integrase
MPSIQARGPYQFRAQVRRKGTYVTRTFESRREAEDWARVMEGRVTGGEVVQRQTVVSLADACAWMSSHVAASPNAKNERTHIAYWAGSMFATWSLSTIHDWDLIEWRRTVLDEDNAEDEGIGPDAAFGPQTCIHRLNTLSKIIQTWGRANRVTLDNPVTRGVRPGKPDGRTRRLNREEEARLLTACQNSTRYWLKAAIILSIETAIRQSELAGLTWNRVDRDRRCIDLIKTKNDRARRVPLSNRALSVIKGLPKIAPTVLPIQTTSAVFQAFRDIRGNAFGDLRWHDLRHEAICRLFEDTDFRDHEIMAISGHLTPAMLSRYTHLRADRLADRLPGGRLNTRAEA